MRYPWRFAADHGQEMAMFPNGVQVRRATWLGILLGPAFFACGGMTSPSADAGAGDTGSPEDSSTDGAPIDATTDSMIGVDGRMPDLDAGADQATADATDDEGDQFNPPQDASPDSLAGIRQECLKIAKMYLPAPIIPPYAIAGLDMRGGPTGNGSEGWNPADAGSFHYNPALEGTSPITADEAKSVICDPAAYVTCVQPNDAGGVQTCEGLAFAGFNAYGGFAAYYGTADGGPPYNIWGIQVQAWIGGSVDPDLTYRGTVEATSTDGRHYSVGTGAPIMETPSGGTPTPIDFASSVAPDGGPPTAATRALVNGLYQAMMAQFLPAQSIAPDCFASNECNVVVSLPTETLVFVPLHLDIEVVVDGPIYPSQIQTNSILDMLLYSDPQPISG